VTRFKHENGDFREFDPHSSLALRAHSIHAVDFDLKEHRLVPGSNPGFVNAWP
jgi:hypothetical protein